MKKQKKRKKTGIEKLRIKKLRIKREIIIRRETMIGALLFFVVMIFLLTDTGYTYHWENCGKEDVTEDFLDKTADISHKLKVDPDDLMMIMAFESGLNHRKVNSLSGATGLIQWMPETAVELGTTTSELKNMSAMEQLDYVYKYLKPYKGKLRKLSDLYMSVLWPAAVGKKDNYVLFESGTAAYRQNDGLDMNEDGAITKAEATQRVINNIEYYYNEIMDKR